MDYQNRVVLVTGGTAGIGAAIAKAYADCGAQVIVADIVPPDDQPGIRYYRVDLSDADACEQLMQTAFSLYGDVDILINNVGVSAFCPLLELETAQWDKILSTNLRSHFILARELARYRAAAGQHEKYGRIVGLSSSRYLMSEAGTEAYSASKGGIVSLTHALAISLTDYNITVNCISPGWICTAGYDALTTEDHRQHPSGRVGVPEDIVKACFYLTDPANNFINGQNITVDGGMTKKMIYV